MLRTKVKSEKRVLFSLLVINAHVLDQDAETWIERSLVLKIKPLHQAKQVLLEWAWNEDSKNAHIDQRWGWDRRRNAGNYCGSGDSRVATAASLTALQ